MMKDYIDHTLCKNCKLCMEVCPIKRLKSNGQNKMDFVLGREASCQQCGQCMSICKHKAIHIKGIRYDQDFIDLPTNKLTYTNFMDFLSQRRSVRNFTSQAVTDELIQKIIDSIRFAPFGAAPNKMHVTAVNDRKVIESSLSMISAFLNGIKKWIENPVLRLMIRLTQGQETYNTIKKHLYPICKSGIYKLENGDQITRGAPAILIFHANQDAEAHTYNGLIYATYAMLAAQSLGLGATMVQVVPAAMNKDKRIKGIYGIPQEHDAVMSVIIGYPKYKYIRTIKRNKHKVHRVR